MIVSPDDLLNAFRLYCFKRNLDLTTSQIRVARAIFYMIAREREMQGFFFGIGSGKTTLFDLMEQFGHLIQSYHYELCEAEERPLDPRGLSPLRILYPIWNGARIEGVFEQQTLTVDESTIKGTLSGPCGSCGSQVRIDILADAEEIELICAKCQEIRALGGQFSNRFVYMTRDDDHQPCGNVNCIRCNPPRVASHGPCENPSCPICNFFANKDHPYLTRKGDE
jgi:hypothetical protein